MAGRRLIALNAKTGERDLGFGPEGEVDIGVPYNSVPLVYKNVVVVGANTPPGATGGIGNPRAFDARTGAKLWEFNSVAQPGDTGHDTWEGDSWKGRLGANAWPFYFTLDERRGLLYLPLASPIVGAYGGDRKGANLFGNSVVAVDVQTGAYKWHFQTIHHDLWDADPPAPPALFDVMRNGRTIPALGVTTKSGYLYILNRETGQPIFGVEERAVAKSDVPGEVSFPTQPLPVKPPPLARVEYKPDRSGDRGRHDRRAREGLRGSGRSERRPLQRGPVHAVGLPRGRRPAEESRSTFPEASAARTGAASRSIAGPDTCSSSRRTSARSAGSRRRRTVRRCPTTRTRRSASAPAAAASMCRIGDSNWPCQKPPWGRLTAINASTGDVAWQVPLGITEQLPAGKQNTGRPALAGPIVTASGLVFVASTDDNRFRALDAKTGKELWVTTLERRGNANPITYQGRNGKQYVAIVRHRHAGGVRVAPEVRTMSEHVAQLRIRNLELRIRGTNS